MMFIYQKSRKRKRKKKLQGNGEIHVSFKSLERILERFPHLPYLCFLFFFLVKLQINSSSLNEEMGMGCGGLRCLLRESGERQEWEVMFFSLFCAGSVLLFFGSGGEWLLREKMEWGMNGNSLNEGFSEPN
ncbi:hypothetical protein V6Z11_A03G179500 [Gossypium hirsutum]